ncbi:DsbA family oxidoreductase [Neptunicella marina]|uniref:DsbA family oxidoreductase n=1 Tax=Neptunicella marina TaxID=2125989 RepID=A0A8J6ITU8_9ALTE|nr:DsbA family oxidoreductase [Neptunicella marina]MBC3765812.1 DsbA family oxidoreductase [Neptunicella marina]
MLRIDIIGDINCPWCALGLTSLNKAIEQIADDIELDIHSQPFELNAALPAEGVGLKQYLQQQYGMSDAQFESSHQMLAERGRALGFNFAKRERLWNTFNCHRLIFWAGEQYGQGQQLALLRELTQAYQGEALDISQPEVLLNAVQKAGLDSERAAQILASDEYSVEVRKAQKQWRDAGVSSVPTVVINGRHALSGAQPTETYVAALRDLASQQ